VDRTDKLLTALWLVWGAVLIVVLVIYSLLTPLFDSDGVRAAWSWLLPNVLPPMAMVAGVSYQQGKKDAAAASATMIGKGPAAPWAALFTSVFYLVLLSVSVMGLPFSAAPLDMMHMSNLWLGPILAIATALLASRFAR
jgi:hypothetical protein